MKKNMSFEKARAGMLRAFIKNLKGSVITKTIPFVNNDVPKFLKKLNQFEEMSKNVKIIIKA